MSTERRSIMRNVVDRVEPVELCEVEMRASDQRRRRVATISGLSAMLAIAFAGFVTIQSGQRDDTISVASEGTDNSVSSVADTAGGATATRTSGDIGDDMGLVIHAESEHPDILSVSVAAPTSGEGPDAQHDLIVTNETDETLHFADPRHAELLGRPPSLIVGTEGCGYGRRAVPNSDELVVACRAYWAGFSLDPGASHTIQVSIWTGIEGLGRVTPEEYLFETEFAYRTGTPLERSDPSDDLATVRTTISYEFELDR